MEMTFAVAVCRRRSMPRADEARALPERVIAQRNDREASQRAIHQKKKAGRARAGPAWSEFSYASLIRFARGPFWLGSISKLTRSPPASESKFTAESSPVRWKKYSRPSSAAMNPNPRSETNFLMVPVGISLLPHGKQCRERTALSRTSTAAAPSPAIRATDQPYHRRCGPQEHHKASRVTATRVATAPTSFIGTAALSRNLQTPQTATPTTEVSRTGATTDRGPRLSAHSTSKYPPHMKIPISTASARPSRAGASDSPDAGRRPAVQRAAIHCETGTASAMRTIISHT